MKKPDISSDHMTAKKDSYWQNLTGGNTGSYKEKILDELISIYGDKKPKHLLDIGCGTCELVFKYEKKFDAASVTCMDYDPKVISLLKEKYPNESVNWVVQDVFTLKDWPGQKFDLILLLDMIHEVYSFHGRPGRDVTEAIDHQKGLKIVKDMISNVCAVTSQTGSILITDNVVCEENQNIEVKIKKPEALQAVRYFFDHYLTKRFSHHWLSQDILEMNSRDFCTLLTQYNKVKSGNWDRWNVEKLETHQYFTLNEFEKAFSEYGFDVHAVIGTPDDAEKEWNEDFQVLKGLSRLPEKRITLLAKRSKS